MRLDFWEKSHSLHSHSQQQTTNNNNLWRIGEEQANDFLLINGTIIKRTLTSVNSIEREGYYNTLLKFCQAKFSGIGIGIKKHEIANYQLRILDRDSNKQYSNNHPLYLQNIINIKWISGVLQWERKTQVLISCHGMCCQIICVTLYTRAVVLPCSSGAG